MIRKYIPIILILTITLIFSGCSQTTSPDGKPEPTEPKHTSEPEFEDNPVLISTKGYQITKQEFFDILPAMTDRERILTDKDALKLTLKVLLEEKILIDKAKELEYDKDADYLTRVEQLEKELEFKKREAMISTMFKKEIDKQYEYNDEAVKNFYKMNQSRFEKRVFSEILRIVKDPNDLQEVKKVEKEINMIYKKLKDGAKFEDLAKEYYNGNSIIQQRGGSLGIIRKGKYPMEFETMGYETLKKEGDISKPFLYAMGWSIIRLDKIYGFEEQKEFIEREYERATRANINKKLAEEYLNPLKYKYDYKDIEIEKIIFNR